MKQKTDDLSSWASRMNRLGEWKRKERSRWLAESTLSDRLAIADDLLRLPGRARIKPEPSDFVALSVALERAENGGR